MSEKISNKAELSLPEPGDMPKAYDPAKYETAIYDWWDAHKFFKPEQQIEMGLADPKKKPFVIPMPPPNVTGALHLGHAMTASLEDLMIRYHRMLGEPTLWVPGTDHAGIATQNVVERKLAEQGISRHDLGREKFLEEVWKWKEEYGNRITIQHRRLGVSCDWDRERFTLDEGLSKAVRAAFKRLYDKGLIYKGSYLVNWCPRCGTAISDLEVVHREEAGTLYYFKYPLEDSGYLPVATTRPETILGDTAVAVNPNDDRYKKYIGKYAIVPIIGRRIPVIADEHVDMEFGTGALKVTPAHDPDDYEIGKKHNLEFITVMNPDGTMNENAGPYEGLTREECRVRLWEDMKKAGLTIKEEPYTHSVGHCQRCDTVIEPMISEQWFVKIKPLAEPALAAVKEGRIQIIPHRFEKVYFNWMENIRDWCISRQLWWGHRIPVWYCDDCGGITVSEEEPKVCSHCGSPNIHQEEDVLDTWFSSGLWPFSTLGWPEETEDYKRYYPTSVLETGYDILFFWVARMIMMGIEMTGKEPFHTVYLHGLIRDEYGRKMSKSLKNALDPLELIEEYGTDALRYTLVTGSTPGNDMKLAKTKLADGRNFANKIWNASRFVISNLTGKSVRAPGKEEIIQPDDVPDLASKWILSRLHHTISEVTRLIDAYQFGEAGRLAHDFFWGEYCDWYLEMSKVALYGEDEEAAQSTRRVLAYVLERSLRLLHPFMPFVTETTWQILKKALDRPDWNPALIVTPWPQAGNVDERVNKDVGEVVELIRNIRNVRAEYQVEPSKRITAILKGSDRVSVLEEMFPEIAFLARLDTEKSQVSNEASPPEQAVTVVSGEFVAYLPLSGMVDVEAERKRLQGELEKVRQLIDRSEKLLSNKGFVEKAPEAVVQRERDKLEDLKRRERNLIEHIDALS